MGIMKPQINQNLNKDQLQELGLLRERYNLSLIKIMEKTNKNHGKLDLSKVWEDTENLTELFDQLTDLKKCLDSFRPLNSSALQSLNQSLDIEYTYESNTIEGNSLTLVETDLVINKGLTIGGKPLVDHLEAINHQEAIYYIRDLAKNNIEISEREIKNIYAIILKSIQNREAGAYRKSQVYINLQDGSKHEFPQPYIVPKLMEDFLIFLNENKDKLHPVEMAAQLHQKLVNIHPFIDGNGRTSRLLMNLFLIQNDYTIAIINSEMSKRKQYYQLLSDFQTQVGYQENGDSKPFALFIAQRVKESLFNQLNFFSVDISDDAKDKGYYFFKKIEPMLNN
jgi:Fic family protein